MSELCSSKSHFSSLVISDFILLCSFILSHPLYFSYFIFFSPYLLKLISFLSPLFITTSLLCLAFLLHTQSSHTRFTSILQTLQFNKDSPNEEENDVVDLGIYEIVFGPPSMAAVTETETENDDPSQILDQTPKKDHILDPNPLLGSDNEAPIIGKIENLKASESEAPSNSVMAEKRLENFLKILDEFERLASNVNEKKKMKKQEPSSIGAKSDKVVGKKQKSLFINGSEAAACNNNQINLDSNVGKQISTMAKSHSQRITSSSAADDRDSLSTYGSMRREREWNRTLAGKLFEERHNAGGGGGGGEAMDSLWETYEMDSDKPGKRRSEKVGRRGKILEREVEEDDVIGGQLCCLQALKMSAGKMNLGVGKPNLVKISKAIKGIGWLHNLTKNSKKVHNNGDHRF